MATYTITLNANGNADKVIDGLRSKLSKIQGIASKNIKMPTMSGGGFEKMGSSLGGFMGKLGGLGAVVGGAVAAMGALSAGINQVSRAMDVFSSRENAETAFETLLGSKEAARKRVKDLTTFATTTPYKQDELFKVNKMLQASTSGDLADTSGMRLIGDAVAATGAEFERAAMHIGRMYSAMKGGRSFGGALNELSEMGILSEEVYQKLSKISSGEIKVDPSQALNILNESLSQFEGGMDKMSQTWEGKMSTMSDAWDEVLYQMVAPIMTELKPALDWIIQGFDSMVDYAKIIGQTIGNWIYSFQEFFQGGDVFSKLGELLLAVFLGAGKGLLTLMLNIPSLMIDPMLNMIISTGKALWGILTSGDLWMAIGELGILAMVKMGQVLMDSVIFIISKLVDAVKWIADMLDIEMDDYGKEMRKWSAEYFGGKNDALSPEKFDELLGNAAKALDETGAMDHLSDAMDARDKLLSNIGSTIGDSINEEIAKTGFEFKERPREEEEVIKPEKPVVSEPEKPVVSEPEKPVSATKEDKAAENTMSQALKAVIDAVSKTGSIGANVGNGYGNILSPLEIAQNAQNDIASQQLHTAEQQLSVMQLMQKGITHIAEKIGSNNTVAVYS